MKHLVLLLVLECTTRDDLDERGRRWEDVKSDGRSVCEARESSNGFCCILMNFGTFGVGRTRRGQLL